MDGPFGRRRKTAGRGKGIKRFRLLSAPGDLTQKRISHTRTGPATLGRQTFKKMRFKNGEPHLFV